VGNNPELKITRDIKSSGLKIIGIIPYILDIFLMSGINGIRPL